MRAVAKMQNGKKGDFARHKMKGKRAIELGAGMGLGGFALALLGCQTIVTDTKEVLSLLERNYENNLTPAAIQGRVARVFCHMVAGLKSSPSLPLCFATLLCLSSSLITLSVYPHYAGQEFHQTVGQVQGMKQIQI